MKYFFAAFAQNCVLRRPVSVAATLLALVGVLAFAPQAHCDIINVDFNTPSASAGNGVLRSDGTTNLNPFAAGASTGTWNEAVVASGNTITAPAPPTAPYVDASGNPTSLTVSLSNFNGPGFTGNDVYSPAPGFLHSFMLENDSITASMTIGGLTPLATYNLYLYGTNYGGGAGATFTIDSVFQTTTGDYHTSPFTGYAAGSNYVLFTVAADGSGSLGVTVVGSSTANFPGGGGTVLGILNGFQIQSVPEPGSLVLCGLGAIGIFALARRRRTS